MLQYRSGNIFESGAQCIVNPVNIQGVMGAGLAYQFKSRFPGMFENYKFQCERKAFVIGTLILYKRETPWVLLFPTQKEVYKPADLAYIEAGLKKFCSTYKEKGIQSIAFPAVGCGMGKLPWETVRPLLERYLKDITIPVEIYEPLLKKGDAYKHG